MIAFLSGQLLEKDQDSAVVNVQGLGYEVHLSSRTWASLPALGEEVALHIHTSVREDAITLYGFSDLSQKKLFVLLNTVSGIGPKVALAILGRAEVDTLCTDIRLKNMKALTSLPGVGKKTAERLCMELAEKMAAFAPTAPERGGPLPEPSLNTGGQALEDATSALVNLGYSQEIISQALGRVQQADPAACADMTVGELIRAALRTLA
jgi:Holliday junction DNA helicase RuvA